MGFLCFLLDLKYFKKKKTFFRLTSLSTMLIQERSPHLEKMCSSMLYGYLYFEFLTFTLGLLMYMLTFS